MPIENRLIEKMRRQLATGEVVLFTGAGFSHDAVALDGRPVADVDELKRELARLAFPSTPGAASESSLADLFDVAVSRASGKVQSLFDARLRVDRVRTPARFNDWFSLPWKRHYTLNVDDLDEVIQGRCSLPRSIMAISASLHQTPQTSDLLSVHLNGKLREFPHVTFSARQYARRAGMPDPWYELLTSDLLSSPVLFVGTALDEPGLWQHIELRSARNQGDVELRPPSYLVSPTLSPARAALLRRYNVEWVKATEQEYFSEVFDSATTQAEQGHQAIRRQHQPPSAASSLHAVSKLRMMTPSTSLELFLQGREPSWADIQPGGFAVVRSFERELREQLEGRGSRLLLLTGTAASGKSTAAMRLALSLDAAEGETFAYDTVGGSLAANHVLSAARATHPKVLLIDDVDVFGAAAGRLLRDLLELPGELKVIATIRNSRIQGLAIEDELAGTSWTERTIPQLLDDDIDLLLESLKRAGLLGRMVGMSPQKRRQVFREQAGRQLLVAMYYATSGEQLEDKVRSECEDLSGASRLAYGMAALATVEHQSVRIPELLVGLNVSGFSSDGNQVMNEITKLQTRALLLGDGDGLRVRHRWIAEKSLEFFIDNGLIHKVIIALGFALACEVNPQASARSRERRLLRRLINHDRLQRLVDDVDRCREIYVALQDRIGWDFHYWLQRGALEVECGDLSQAKTYLDSARSLVDGTDYNVENEYGYLLLRRASEDPASRTAADDAEEGFAILEEIMRARGRQDSYAYHVYGSQGLRWSRRCPLPMDERTALVRRLLEAVREGREFHPLRGDLRQLESDLEREMLLLAAGGTGS